MRGKPAGRGRNIHYQREGSALLDMGVFYPLLPFGLSSPVTEQLKLALRGKANFAACLALGCSFYPTKKSKISLRGPLLHLPKCGTYVTFLLRVYFSHSHNRADDGTNRTLLTGRGRRLASHYARVCLIFRPAREVAEFTPQKVFSAGTPKARRGVQAAVAPPVNAWLSGARYFSPYIITIYSAEMKIKYNIVKFAEIRANFA